MKRLLSLVFVLMLLPMATLAERTFDAEGTIPDEGEHGYEYHSPNCRSFPDGSFEGGTCLGSGSQWTCTTDNDCDWIADLVPLGLWNYDGAHIAWLGGFCGGVATDETSFCQTVYIGGGG